MQTSKYQKSINVQCTVLTVKNVKNRGNKLCYKNKVKPGIDQVQALADISRPGYVVIAMRPCNDCKSAQ